MQVAAVSMLVFLSVTGNSQAYSLNLSEESSSEVSVARNLPVAILPLALALVGPLVAVFFGSLKPVLLTLGLVYLLLFVLTFVPTLGAMVQTGFRAFGDTLAAAIPPTIGEDLLKATGLDAEECRTRAVCEITEDAVQRFPARVGAAWPDEWVARPTAPGTCGRSVGLAVLAPVEEKRRLGDFQRRSVESAWDNRPRSRGVCQANDDDARCSELPRRGICLRCLHGLLVFVVFVPIIVFDDASV
ncbi:secreted protein, putative [Ixodes scapularis]|uniref:Secreted protein, putative n=1 Tax=Ixodes scapularis TaxID=6945 RepID=B7Q5E8_IXOSC|nr:secreted protein, putative [Ixodes scapularis]|eukprot:XP_002401873.1 secreted protein, putative [Ixodes scapularis]